MKPVIIVGGGAAGAAAAIELAKADVPTLVLEHLQFPRFRPGETLHPGVEPLFKSLGVIDKINELGPIRHTGNLSIKQDGTEVFNAYGDANNRWLGYQIPRAKLDHILSEAAIEAGAEWISPVKKIGLIHNDAGRIIAVQYGDVERECSYLIDATGQSHWLIRKLGIQWEFHSPKLFAAYGYVSKLSDAVSNYYSVPVFQESVDGWLWTALIEQDKISWVRLCEKKLNQEVPTHLNGCEVCGDVYGSDVTWRIANQLAGKGWMLSGDAAAVLDPSSSHGVLKAMMSGMMCAHLIKALFEGSYSESEIESYYSKWVRSWFLNDVKQLKSVSTK